MTLAMKFNANSSVDGGGSYNRARTQLVNPTRSFQSIKRIPYQELFFIFKNYVLLPSLSGEDLNSIQLQECARIEGVFNNNFKRWLFDVIENIPSEMPKLGKGKTYDQMIDHCLSFYLKSETFNEIVLYPLAIEYLNNDLDLEKEFVTKLSEKFPNAQTIIKEKVDALLKQKECDVYLYYLFSQQKSEDFLAALEKLKEKLPNLHKTVSNEKAEANLLTKKTLKSFRNWCFNFNQGKGELPVNRAFTSIVKHLLNQFKIKEIKDIIYSIKDLDRRWQLLSFISSDNKSKLTEQFGFIFENQMPQHPSKSSSNKNEGYFNPLEHFWSNNQTSLHDLTMLAEVKGDRFMRAYAQADNYYPGTASISALQTKQIKRVIRPFLALYNHTRYGFPENSPHFPQNGNQLKANLELALNNKNKDFLPIQSKADIDLILARLPVNSVQSETKKELTLKEAFIYKLASEKHFNSTKKNGFVNFSAELKKCIATWNGGSELKDQLLNTLKEDADILLNVLNSRAGEQLNKKEIIKLAKLDATGEVAKSFANITTWQRIKGFFGVNVPAYKILKASLNEFSEFILNVKSVTGNDEVYSQLRENSTFNKKLEGLFSYIRELKHKTITLDDLKLVLNACSFTFDTENFPKKELLFNLLDTNFKSLSENDEGLGDKMYISSRILQLAFNHEQKNNNKDSSSRQVEESTVSQMKLIVDFVKKRGDLVLNSKLLKLVPPKKNPLYEKCSEELPNVRMVLSYFQDGTEYGAEIFNLLYDLLPDEQRDSVVKAIANLMKGDNVCLKPLHNHRLAGLNADFILRLLEFNLHQENEGQEFFESSPRAAVKLLNEANIDGISRLLENANFIELANDRKIDLLDFKLRKDLLNSNDRLRYLSIIVKSYKNAPEVTRKEFSAAHEFAQNMFKTLDEILREELNSSATNIAELLIPDDDSESAIESPHGSLNSFDVESSASSDDGDLSPTTPRKLGRNPMTPPSSPTKSMIINNYG